MVRFIDVDPETLAGNREGRRGRVSYPICKMFLESNKAAAQIDRTGMQQSLMSLTSCLNSYVKSHNLPIRIMQRGGEIILLRTDLEKGTEATTTTDGNKGTKEHMEAKPITATEVQERFKEEVGQVAK